MSEKQSSGKEKGGKKTSGKVVDISTRLDLPPEKSEVSNVSAAWDLIYEAREIQGREKRVKLANKALELWPDCADAYIILAEDEAGTVEEAAEYFEKAVKAGERVLGKKTFEEDKGHFWGLLETRPYMAARAGLAFMLIQMGKTEEAAQHYREMLALNPGDNQGIRYELAALLVELECDEELGKLLARYEGDGSAAFTYTSALLNFRKDGDSPRSRDLLAEAFKSNPYVPRYLLGRNKLPEQFPTTIGFGDESEAVYFSITFLPGWFMTVGAIDWLREYEAGLKEQGPGGGAKASPKAGRNEPCPCGSGKKYKKCCLGVDNTNEGPSPGGTGDSRQESLRDEIRQFVEGKSFEPVEEFQAETDRFMDVRNVESIEDFDGLSADQMTWLLYYPFDANSPLTINADAAVPEDIPFLRLFTPIIRELARKPLKATATGNLPLKLVKAVANEWSADLPEIYRRHYLRIRSEKDFMDFHTVRLTALMGGFIKKRHQCFSLTKRGESILADGFGGEVFRGLFETYAQKFNWGFRDRYPDLQIVQLASFYALYLLKKYGGEERPMAFYGDKFLLAFPMAIHDVDEKAYSTREETVMQCFALRAMDRFAHFFGFMEYAEKDYDLFNRFERNVRKTPFLDDWISFRLN
ncbi:MAG: SEC-C metal-binding domain-containing protein [bacterium]|nr:SEC-C metal-binding domain-containing protein [bacterium]MDT8367449.1 SEC-C metal-binding domain-containing protein [bacterium]